MFASYSHGDLIFETVGYPDSIKKKRIFYGFKNDGRGLFINNETNENFFISLWILIGIHIYMKVKI